MFLERKVPRLSASGLLMLALAFGNARAGDSGDLIFADDFEPLVEVPISDSEAARFLTQAAFGPTRSGIDALKSSGFEAWIDAQMALPATLARPFLEQVAVTENLAGRSLTSLYRVQHWFDTAVTAPDQLRQKAAYALGQIIVVSDQDPDLFEETIMMAEWNDLLVRNALGNYRTLLAEVARSPMMGRYLSHLRNRRFELMPRCEDKLPPINDNGGEFHPCDSSDATNNGTETPTIVRYVLPPGGLVAPDENFAREVMQLFSIGLVERNLDFTPIEIDGEPVPTYDQDMIGNTARVLTGLGYACSGPRTVAGQEINRLCGCTGIDCNFSLSAFAGTPPDHTINGAYGLVHPDRYEPLVCYPRFHDIGRDHSGFQLPGPDGTDPAGAEIALMSGESIPAGTPEAFKPLVLGGAELARIDETSPGEAPDTALNCRLNNLDQAEKQACVAYCDAGLETSMDVLFEHPNTAVMVARQLIQRLVTSNPSPGYIQRVSEAFVDNGSGVRGDLAAVVRAILLDEEARAAPAGGSLAEASDGKPREPMLKLIHIWRALGAVSETSHPDGFSIWARFNECRPSRWPYCNYLQRPLGAPSVFNFYEPDYTQPGPIAEAELFSPELKIVNESTAILAGNDLYNQICSGYGSDDCHGPLGTPPALAAHFPAEALDVLPGGACGSSCTGADDAALIDALDVLLLEGNMSGTLGAPEAPGSPANTGMRGILYRLLREDLAGGLGEPDPQDGRRRAILYLTHLVAISPEFATQR